MVIKTNHLELLFGLARDWWRYVTLKGEGRDPDMFGPVGYLVKGMALDRPLCFYDHILVE